MAALALVLDVAELRRDLVLVAAFLLRVLRASSTVTGVLGFDFALAFVGCSAVSARACRFGHSGHIGVAVAEEIAHVGDARAEMIAGTYTRNGRSGIRLCELLLQNLDEDIVHVPSIKVVGQVVDGIKNEGQRHVRQETAAGVSERI